MQIHCCETKGGRQVLAATSTRLLDWSALNFNIGLLRTTSCCSRTHSFFNLSSHGHERLFYICGVLCTGFQKRNSKRICKFLRSEKQQTVSSHTNSQLTWFPGAPPRAPRPPPKPSLTCTKAFSRSLSCLHLWHTGIRVPSCFPTLNSTAFMAQPSTEPSPPCQCQHTFAVV